MINHHAAFVANPSTSNANLMAYLIGGMDIMLHPSMMGAAVAHVMIQ
jgi:hypothetical protein